MSLPDDHRQPHRGPDTLHDDSGTPHDDGSDRVRRGHEDHVGDDVGHGPADGHGPAAPSEPLGPVDTRAWAAAVAGSALAVVVVIALALTTAT